MNNSNTWIRQSVRSFWQGINWENRPLEIVTNQLNGQANGQPMVASALSLSLPVKKYFSLIQWTGIPLAAPPVQSSTPIQVEQEKLETLEDFLDDISQFF